MQQWFYLVAAFRPKAAGAAGALAALAFALSPGLCAFSDRQVVRSSHFVVRYETAYPPAGVLNVLEGLHAKLMLDLQSLVPWAAREPIDITLYKDADSYRRQLNMPVWAGAHVLAAERKVYAFEDDRFQVTMAHELAHLFLHAYFGENNARPPLWLDEGVATVMEVDYGGPGAERDVHLSSEHFPPFEQFFQFTLRGQPGQTVALWYAQAESVTRFLMRRFTRAQFTAFCAALREGQNVDSALKSAYGLQMPDAAALERLWREEKASK